MTSRRRTRLRLRSAEDLEELVNELFDRVFQRKHRLAYDVTRDFGPYLKVIARNLLADYWQKRGREVPLEREEKRPRAIRA
jgi:DNA-directed RNA polymerase specialized sigma24 family protein